jgi:hypothetical protein
MGMADRVSSGVPYISTSSLAHGVTHFYSSVMISIVAWFRATMTFPVKKKQKGDSPCPGGPLFLSGQFFLDGSSIKAGFDQS